MDSAFVVVRLLLRYGRWLVFSFLGLATAAGLLHCCGVVDVICEISQESVGRKTEMTLSVGSRTRTREKDGSGI